MAKLLKMVVKCDNCSWHQQIKNPYSWLDKKCPKCGTVVINHGDLKYWRFIKLIILIDNIIQRFFPKVKTKTIRVSSRLMHEKYKGKNET